MSWLPSLRESEDTHDLVFGELFELVPRIAGKNASGSTDPARTVYRFTGLFYEDDTAIDGAPHADRRSTRPSVCVQSRYLTEPVKRGDHLKQLAKGTIWEVTSVSEDGKFRVALHLIEIGRGARI